MFQKNSKNKRFDISAHSIQENAIMKPNLPNEKFSDYEAPSSSADIFSYRNAECIWDYGKW